MSEKKHIDRVFQEKLKDFEDIPNDVVWENIKSKLEKEKEDDKVIPIWWRLAGVAAVLLLLLTIGGLVINNKTDSKPEIQVVDTENNTSPENLNTQKPSDAIKEPSDLNPDSNQNETLASENNSIQTNQEGNITTNNKTKSNGPSVDKFSTVNNESAIASTSSSTNKNLKNNDALVNSKVSNKNNTLEDLNNSSDKKDSEQPNSSLAEVPQKHDDILNKNNTEDINNVKFDSSIIDDSEVTIAQNETSQDTNLEDTISSDSLTIEGEIAKIEDIKNIIEEEKQLNRWSISPNVAPVYFNSLGNGSSIDEQFNNNSKTGEVNMSYGITGSYSISDKLVVRAGINKVNLGYNTNDILLLETTGKGPNSALLSNITENNNEEHMSVVNARSVLVEQNSNLVNTSNVGSINQTLGFVEIPVELQYSLLNTKLGVNIIGGFSSFFLNENKLRSEINGNNILIGEANNVNSVSYSANFGLGLNYNFSKSFDFNLEPIFKYQINTFSNTSGSFKPYFIGFYTGFSFKF
ncbi:MAG TPA: hypothetical protein VKN14_07790 [Flavobacteriaceae bacterium]|nr:hypothetical protein [Flavobacteriaceae bacterium]